MTILEAKSIMRKVIEYQSVDIYSSETVLLALSIILNNVLNEK